jgi:hypothetical protein
VCVVGVDSFAPSMLSRLLEGLACTSQSSLSGCRRICICTFFVTSPSLCSWSLKRFISSCSLPVLLRSDIRSVASQSGALWSVASRPLFRNCNCARRFSMWLSKSWTVREWGVKGQV